MMINMMMMMMMMMMVVMVMMMMTMFSKPKRDGCRIYLNPNPFLRENLKFGSVVGDKPEKGYSWHIFITRVKKCHGYNHVKIGRLG